MKFILFFLFLISFAHAQSPWYFGNGEAVNLTNGTAYKNGVKTISGSLDPSATAVSAPSGSMYYSTSGTIYVKQDAGLTTNWLPLGIATTGSLTTLNGQSGPNVNIATGSSGSDFNIAAGSNIITLNLPSASGSNRGLLTSSDWTLFNGKQANITGAATTITSSDLTANRAVISNGSGKVAVSSVTDTELGYLGGVTSAVQTQIDSKEPAISAGTTGQYWRGDKSWQTLDKTAVGLSNVDNTSDASKPISTATQTALDAKVTGQASSVDGEIALFDSTTGKVIKRATGSGYVKATSGVYSTSSTVAVSDLSGQVSLGNGGTNKNMTAVNGGVVYTDADSQEVSAAGTSGQVLQSNGAAAPTWVNKSISGKAQNKTAVTVEEIQAPNNLLTPTASGKYLNETGNKNILENPSFENTTYSTSWNLGSGSPSSEMVTVIDGKQALFVTYSAEAASAIQDSTLYQAQFADGVQGLAMVRVKTTVSGIKVCPRQAATTSTNCVNVNNDGKWGLYKVPFILGATSNGIFIGSTSNVTGDVYIDDAFVGPVDLKADTGSVTIQSSKISGASIASGAVISGTITTDGSGNYTQSSGVFTALKDLHVTISCRTDNSAASGTIPTIYVNSVNTNAGSVAPGVSGNFIMATWTGKVSAASTFECRNNNSTATLAYVFVSALNVNNSATYSATNANTSRASCGHTTSDFTGFGTVTNIETQCYRDGEHLVMSGKFTTGTNTAVEARLALKMNGLTLTSAGTSKIPSLQLSGSSVTNASSTTFFGNSTLIEPSVGYITWGRQSSTTDALTKATGSGVASTGGVVSFTARIPINGWENSNVIIGTFNEVMTTPGITKPKTCYYDFGGASATLAAPTECTTGTCIEITDSCNAGTPPAFASTGIYTGLTFASGTFAASSRIQCSCVSYDTTTNTGKECNPYFVTGQVPIITNSSGGYSMNIITSDTNPVANSTSYVQVTCEGQAP